VVSSESRCSEKTVDPVGKKHTGKSTKPAAIYFLVEAVRLLLIWCGANAVVCRSVMSKSAAVWFSYSLLNYGNKRVMASLDKGWWLSILRASPLALSLVSPWL
jgi:hypothetical protein